MILFNDEHDRVSGRTKKRVAHILNRMWAKQSRGDDLPLHGRIVREKKGVYVVMITFAKSRRHYGDEYVWAKDQKKVKAHILKMYPTIKFGKRK